MAPKTVESGASESLAGVGSGPSTFADLLQVDTSMAEGEAGPDAGKTDPASGKDLPAEAGTDLPYAVSTVGQQETSALRAEAAVAAGHFILGFDATGGETGFDQATSASSARLPLENARGRLAVPGGSAAPGANPLTPSVADGRPGNGAAPQADPNSPAAKDAAMPRASFTNLVSDPILSRTPSTPTAEMLRAKMPAIRAGNEGQSARGSDAVPAPAEAQDFSTDTSPAAEWPGDASRQETAATAKPSAGLGELTALGQIAAPVASPSAAPSSSAPTVVASFSGSIPAGLDLATIIDRLADARQAAQPGRVQISLAHDDFGAVGIRLDQTAGAGMLGIALSSGDPGFVPAVHAALAERTASDRPSMAGEQQTQRQEQPAARGDGSAGNGQSHSHQAQSHSDQSRPAPARGAGLAPGGAKAGEKGATTDAPRADARGLYA